MDVDKLELCHKKWDALQSKVLGKLEKRGTEQSKPEGPPLFFNLNFIYPSLKIGTYTLLKIRTKKILIVLEKQKSSSKK